jgi:sensor histidine kinase YesM
MAAIAALPPSKSMPGPATSPEDLGAAAFRRVLNWRNVAVVFYFCLLTALASFFARLYAEDFGDWLLMTVRFLRQNLISGLTLLVVLAAVHAAATRWQLATRRAIVLAAAVALVAAWIAMLARFWVSGLAVTDALASNWAYALATTLGWATTGTLGYAIFRLLEDAGREQARIRDAEQAAHAMQAQRIQAHLSALQAQIEPHFLFNTLANVRRLYETTPHQGRAMMAALIDYLRAALPAMRESGSTLGHELDLVRSYLTILQMRMGERLQFAIDVPDALLAAPMPPMILPTLVENAIQHGIAPLPEGGRIDIEARAEGGALRIAVRDTGAGFHASSGTGVGLANTRARLAALFGPAASLQLRANPARGVSALLTIPAGAA